LGCDQQNLEIFQSDCKLSGHRLAHVFADGWPTVAQRYTNAKSTLLEAPTGTLFFYYKDVKQEIVHTLLLEGYGVSNKWAIMIDRGEDSNSNATWTPAGNSGPSAQDC